MNPHPTTSKSDSHEMVEAFALARQMILRGAERKHVEAALTELGMSSDEAKVEYGITQRAVQREVAGEQVAETQTAAEDSAATDGVDKIRRALFEEAQSVWDAEGPPRVEIEGGCGLLHEGVGLYLFGPRNGGKSTTAQTLELNAAMHGVKVLHLDRENSPTLGKDRLESAIVGVDAFDADTLREFYEARHWPHFSLSWKPEDYADTIEQEGYKVVCYDSVRELLKQLGLSSNSEDDWSELYQLLGTPLIERGITPIFLDNTGNSDKATRRPRGSSAKLDAVPQGFRVWSIEMFSPEITGRIGIECVRSRYGDEDRLWTMTIGGGHWELPTEAADRAQVATSWDSIIDALDGNDPMSYPAIAEASGLSQGHVERLVRGNLRSESPEVVKAGGRGEPARIHLRGAAGMEF